MDATGSLVLSIVRTTNNISSIHIFLYHIKTQDHANNSTIIGETRYNDDVLLYIIGCQIGQT